jgi:hypothetical protein
VKNLLVRAIITGFGLRLGSELGKFVAERVFPKKDDKKDKDEEDDGLGSLTSEPPEV